MTSTLMGTSRWDTMATTTGTGPPSPGRPRPPAFTLELLQPEKASKRVSNKVATASCESVFPMFMEWPVRPRAPVYKIEEEARPCPQRLPGKHNYVQVYLYVTRHLPRRTAKRYGLGTPGGLRGLRAGLRAGLRSDWDAH